MSRRKCRAKRLGYVHGVLGYRQTIFHGGKKYISVPIKEHEFRYMQSGCINRCREDVSLVVSGDPWAENDAAETALSA